jgi:hypothetical protein
LQGYFDKNPALKKKTYFGEDYETRMIHIIQLERMLYKFRNKDLTTGNFINRAEKRQFKSGGTISTLSRSINRRTISLKLELGHKKNWKISIFLNCFKLALKMNLKPLRFELSAIKYHRKTEI